MNQNTRENNHGFTIMGRPIPGKPPLPPPPPPPPAPPSNTPGIMRFVIIALTVIGLIAIVIRFFFYMTADTSANSPVDNNNSITQSHVDNQAPSGDSTHNQQAPSFSDVTTEKTNSIADATSGQELNSHKTNISPEPKSNEPSGKDLSSAASSANISEKLEETGHGTIQTLDQTQKDQLVIDVRELLVTHEKQTAARDISIYRKIALDILTSARILNTLANTICPTNTKLRGSTPETDLTVLDYDKPYYTDTIAGLSIHVMHSSTRLTTGILRGNNMANPPFHPNYNQIRKTNLEATADSTIAAAEAILYICSRLNRKSALVPSVGERLRQCHYGEQHIVHKIEIARLALSDSLAECIRLLDTTRSYAGQLAILLSRRDTALSSKNEHYARLRILTETEMQLAGLLAQILAG